MICGLHSLKSIFFLQLKTDHLPLLSCVWISPDSIVAAGHGCTPLVFKVDGSGEVAFVSKLEDKKGDASEKKFSARAFFDSRDKRGNESTDTVLNTTHQNQISCIQIQSGGKNRADKISTSGGDGKVVVWDLRTLEKQIAGLSI